MNILDIIILICLIPALIQGLIKGFISQAIAIISLIAGVWASARFAGVVCEWLSQYISGSEQVLRIAAFALIFILVIAVLSLIGKILDKIIQIVMLGWLNKLLGGVFAILKWVLIMSLIVVAFNSINQTFNIVKPNVLAESQLHPVLTEIANTVFPYLKSLLKA